MANNLHHRLLVKMAVTALRGWKEEADASRQRREMVAEMFLRLMRDHLAEAFVGWREASRASKGEQRMLSAVELVLAHKLLRRTFQVLPPEPSSPPLLPPLMSIHPSIFC